MSLFLNFDMIVQINIFHAELKADWLIDPRFKELPDKSAKYFVVRIRGTRDELPMWNEGSRENTEGIVVSILETSQSYIKTAYIKILPGLQEELVVPIKYLVSTLR